MNSKQIINDAVSSVIINTVWTSYFYYSSFFESISRYLVAGTTLSGDVDVNGMTVSTASGTDYVTLEGATNTLITTKREVRFRTSASVSAITDVDASVLTLWSSSTGSFAGFEFVNGTLNGTTSDGAVTKTVPLMSYVANTYYLLELDFRPNAIVRFSVNGVQLGSITSNLPASDINLSIYQQVISVAGASARTIKAQYFQIIQGTT